MINNNLKLKHYDSLVNEYNESFNFGVKDGVRGFFTDPSRADDSFIPFKSKLTCIKIASQTGNSTWGNTFNCATIVPDYQELTVDNFYYRITGRTKYASGGAEHVYASISYNASNGDVSVQLASAGGGVGYQYSYDVYCIY